MTTDGDNSELLLTAFRYVAGELSAEEAADFETLLSDDQAARDALADVVVLSEAMAVEEFERIHPQRIGVVPSRRVFPKWGSIVALCILVVAGLTVLNPDNPPDLTDPGEDLAVQPVHPMPLSEVGDPHSVLSLWSELRGGDSDQYAADPYLVEESETFTSAPNEVPDWMLSAIVSGTDAPPVNMPEDMRELMDDPDRENL
jgi:hypothetical protein